MRVSAQPSCIGDVHHDVLGSLIFGDGFCPVGLPRDFQGPCWEVVVHPKVVSFLTLLTALHTRALFDVDWDLANVLHHVMTCDCQGSHDQ